MHTLFFLLVLLLAAVVGGVGVLLHRLAPAGSRRPLALVVLVAPLFVLAVGVFHIVHQFWPQCAPFAGWDRLASFGLLSVVVGIAMGALTLNMARLVLVERLLSAAPGYPARRAGVPSPLAGSAPGTQLGQHPPLVDGAITTRLATLSRHLGINPPVLRVLQTDAPLAVSGGLWRPTIVLSRGLVEELDYRELEAVLAHELAHVARRDNWTRWLGRLLRDVMVYLPSGWYALRVLEADEEVAADALAVEATRRPLSMASALCKIWRSAASTPSFPAGVGLGIAGLPGFAGDLALLEERLSRLADKRATRPSPFLGRLLSGVSLVSVGGLVPQLLAASALPLVCSLRPF